MGNGWKETQSSTGMTVGGVFSGIGGFELGFRQAGFSSRFVCEIDSDAGSVLEEHFPGTTIYRDICDLAVLPKVDVLVAGFPCQDLSAVGPRVGLSGAQSSLINKLFELIEKTSKRPDWIVLENVPFMLQLHGGQAIDAITRRLNELAYRWAYRVVDTQAFGLPHRRKRVFLVATRGTVAPSEVIFADDASGPSISTEPAIARGFYWTEGNRGVGWAIDAIPTLKGGSALSIPSPPAFWIPASCDIRLPDIRDAERLQGFEENWTFPTEATNGQHGRRRWRQVGNAVSVPVVAWIAGRIAKPGSFDSSRLRPFPTAGRWPNAACGSQGLRQAVFMSEWPIQTTPTHLHEFLRYEGNAISQRAANGFFQRVRRTTLKLEDGFLRALAVAAGFDPSEGTRIAHETPIAGKAPRSASVRNNP
jgi:DNA (cytosine-5)-methyltransferase 1